MSRQHKHSGHKRDGPKHKRTERKDKRSGHKRSGHKRSGHNKAYRKGSKSKTMKGKKDFTTKKTSKVFNRRKHYQKHAKGSRVNRRPYAKKGGAGPAKKSIDASKIQQVRHTNLEIETEHADPQTIVLNNDRSSHTATKGTASGLVDAINSVLPKKYHANQVSSIKLAGETNVGAGQPHASSIIAYLNPTLFSAKTIQYLQNHPTALNKVAEEFHKYFARDTVYIHPTNGSIPYWTTLGDGYYNISNTVESWKDNLV